MNKPGCYGDFEWGQQAAERDCFNCDFQNSCQKTTEDNAMPIGTTENTAVHVPEGLLHPLYPVFRAAIEQAMYGKGERHGGAVTPFLEQPWKHYASMHGRGFLTGQAAKKLEEAASLRTGDAFVQEMLGAMVYAGMAILQEQSTEEPTRS